MGIAYQRRENLGGVLIEHFKLIKCLRRAHILNDSDKN